MSKKDKVLCIVFTIIISVLCLIPIYNFKVHAKKNPVTLYRIYLDGKSIGVIESKDKLVKLINEEQKDLIDKYKVDTIYTPNGLYISEYVSYDDNVVSEKEIYDKIIENKSFTIKGYVVTIKCIDDEDSEEDSEEVCEDIKFNILRKEDFTNAISSVVKAFVPEEELNIFLSGEEVVIERTGSKIEDLYIKEEITLKESYIPSDQNIFLDEKEIIRYLLFGNNIEEKSYTVKAGDTISSIAENNKLAVEELLVVNQDLKSKNSLLSIGQEVNVALINPILTVVEEAHVVEEQKITYSTEVQYDGTKPAGTTTIKQEGKDGLQIVTQKLQYENGELIRALIANTEVIEEVINQIKVIGTMSNVIVDPSQIPDAGDWYWPTNKPYIITSPFGWRWGSLHEGVDISGTGFGSPIYAANNGVVYKAWYDSIGGNQVIIAHEDNYYTMYAHMAYTPLVQAGQTVTRGQKIGYMGSTGVSTGPHLHFGAYLGVPYRGGTPFNGLTLFR